MAGIKINGTIRLVEREKEEIKKQLHLLEALSRIAGEIAGGSDSLKTINDRYGNSQGLSHRCYQ